jgi:hypothetical protein
MKWSGQSGVESVEAYEFAVTRPSEEACVDECGQDGFALDSIEPPHTLYLRRGETKARAFKVLCTNV